MKTARLLCSLFLLIMGLVAIYQPGAVLAQDEQEEQEETVELKTSYTKLEGTSGTSFEFEVELTYYGSEARVFDLVATGPKNWTTYITPSYPKEKMIGDIRLEPGQTYGQKINVYAAPPFWLMPEPGEYDITLEATSGEIKGTIDLKAVVTARYDLSLTPAEELYNTSATAGKDNPFSLVVENTGSATIDNIAFSSDKPKGWTIEFTPQKIDSLIAGNRQTVDVNIKPPSETIAGDYEIDVTADAKQAMDEIDIRVSVKSPPVAQWVGVGIIVLVIAGLSVIFMRFSRR